MKQRVLLVCAVTMALLLAACVPIQPEGAGTVPAPAPAAPSAGGPLEDVPWNLTGMAGAEGTLAPLPDGVVVSANFSGGTVSGTSGCNQYSGSYTLDGDSIAWSGPFIMTMMACEGPGMDVETAFHAAMEQVSSFAVDNGTLRLMDAGGNVLLEFAGVQGDPLVGTEWVVTNYNNGNEAVVSVLLDTELTVSFSADGQISGQACNNFFGGYTVDGSAISIGPLGATRMFCEQPEGAMDQENQLLAALESAATFSIRGDMLEMRTADDALAVVLVAADAAQ